MSTYALTVCWRSIRCIVLISAMIPDVLLQAEEKESVGANAAAQSLESPAVPIPVSAKVVRGASAMAPLMEEASARIFTDPPLPNVLMRGMVLIQFRTENLRILPVFGPDAVDVSPRIGHLHVRVDDYPWTWAHTSGDDLIINRLTAGPHKIQVALVNADRKILAQHVVPVEVPEGSHTAAFPREHDLITEVNSKDQPPAMLFVDPPQPEQLAQGIAFIRYRTENAQIEQLFGTTALEISPKICHLHITVDDARWRWAHTSHGPLILAGLPAGPHKILIELVNATHKPIANCVVKFDVPQPLTRTSQSASSQ